MSQSNALYDRIVKVLQTDLEEKSVIIKWSAWRIKLVYEIGEKFWKDDCLMYASSLAYTTLLALAPLMAISLSIFSSFEMSKKTVLNFFFQRLLPNKDLAGIIEENIESFSSNAASVSVFGVIFLVIFAVWVLSTIEYSFNMIWKVGRSRPLISQFVTYWSSVTFTPILIALSIILAARVQNIVLSEEWAQYTYIQSFTLQAIPYLLTWVAFFLVYKLIPYTTVYFKPALTGAVVATFLFEVAKNAFNFYLTNFATYTAVYGALATIPIFLFWLYLTWVIVLLGSVIAYAIQYPKEIKSSKDEGFDRIKYSNYFSLRILIEATWTFESGSGPVDPKYLVKKLEITSEFYDDIVRKLKKLDLVEIIDGSSGRFLLNKPPESIHVTDVLMSLSGESLSVAPEPVDPARELLRGVLANMRGAMEKEMDGLDLLTLSERLSETEKGYIPPTIHSEDRERDMKQNDTTAA